MSSQSGAICPLFPVRFCKPDVCHPKSQLRPRIGGGLCIIQDLLLQANSIDDTINVMNQIQIIYMILHKIQFYFSHSISYFPIPSFFNYLQQSHPSSPCHQKSIYISKIIQISHMYFQKNSHYGKQTFWQKRYAENCTQFDWYQNWANLRDIISQYIKHDSKILNIGAGNSPFSEQMYAEGYKNITNIDFSEIVVEDMQLKYKNCGYQDTLKYVYGDVRNMKTLFESQTFDCVIDKGLLDSILCGSYSKQNSKKMLREISRVLKTKGVYVCISYGDPDIRNHYFEDKGQKYDWGKKNQWPYKIFKPTIDQADKDIVFNDKDKQRNKDYYHYVYIMGKGEDVHLVQAEGQSKSSNAMINSSNLMR